MIAQQIALGKTGYGAHQPQIENAQEEMNDIEKYKYYEEQHIETSIKKTLKKSFKKSKKINITYENVKMGWAR